MFKYVLISLIGAIVLGAMVSIKMLMHIHSLTFDGTNANSARSLTGAPFDVSRVPITNSTLCVRKGTHNSLLGIGNCCTGVA